MGIHTFTKLRLHVALLCNGRDRVYTDVLTGSFKVTVDSQQAGSKREIDGFFLAKALGIENQETALKMFI